MPYITNLRLDPFERMGWPNNGTKEGAQQYFDWFKFQFWRFVFVQQVMGKELQTFLDYPPMQRGASFNLDAVKAEMAKRMEQAEAASKGPGQLTGMTFTAGGPQGPLPKTDRTKSLVVQIARRPEPLARIKNSTTHIYSTHFYRKKAMFRQLVSLVTITTLCFTVSLAYAERREESGNKSKEEKSSGERVKRE